MKLTGRRGRLRLRLAPVEVAVLTASLDDLETTLDGAGDPQVLRRLVPAAYDDDVAEQEFRDLTGSALRTERAERMSACRAELAAGDGGDTSIDIADPETATRWLQVINDLRLALGTRLDITEDEPPGLDPADPALQERTAYYWLTAVQDTVVQALMRR